MSKGIKPCPFCGYKKIIWKEELWSGIIQIGKKKKRHQYKADYLICIHCGVRSPAVLVRQWAVNSWNKRDKRNASCP